MCSIALSKDSNTLQHCHSSIPTVVTLGRQYSFRGQQLPSSCRPLRPRYGRSLRRRPVKCQAGLTGLHLWRSRAWNAVHFGACMASVAGAIGFFVTSEVVLLGLPVTLPLIALLASKQQEKLQAEALVDRYQLALEKAATPEIVKGYLQETLSELQTELQAQQKLPAGQLRALNAKLGALEGSILTAGRSAQSAASQAYGSVDKVATATISEIRHLHRQLQADIQGLIPQRTDPAPQLAALDTRMRGIEDRLVSLGSRQVTLMQSVQNDMSIAWEDAEVALQAVVRAETMRCLEPLRHLPRTLATALPVTDVTAMTVPEKPPRAVLLQEDCERLQGIVASELQAVAQGLAQQQEEAVRALASQPFALADSQWSSLGRRLSGMEQQLQGLQDRPALPEALVRGQQTGEHTDSIALQLEPLMLELKGLKELVRAQAVTGSRQASSLSNGGAAAAEVEAQQEADADEALQAMMLQDRHAHFDVPDQAELDADEQARQEAFERMQSIIASRGPVERDNSVQTLASPSIPSAAPAIDASSQGTDSLQQTQQPFASWLDSTDEADTLPSVSGNGKAHAADAGSNLAAGAEAFDCLPLEMPSPELRQQLLEASPPHDASDSMAQDAPHSGQGVAAEAQGSAETDLTISPDAANDAPVPAPALSQHQVSQRQEDGFDTQPSNVIAPAPADDLSEADAAELQQGFSWKQPEASSSSNGRSSTHRTHMGYQRPSFLPADSFGSSTGSLLDPGMGDNALQEGLSEQDDHQHADMSPNTVQEGRFSEYDNAQGYDPEAGALQAAAELQDQPSVLNSAALAMPWQPPSRDPRTRRSSVIDSSALVPEQSDPGVGSTQRGPLNSSSNERQFSMPLDAPFPTAHPADAVSASENSEVGVQQRTEQLRAEDGSAQQSLPLQPGMYSEEDALHGSGPFRPTETEHADSRGAIEQNGLPGQGDPGAPDWQYNAEESESHRDMEQGWGDLEGLLDRGVQLLKHSRAGISGGADLGGIDACLQDALACFEAAAAIDDSDARILGNWGLTLLTHGQHKQGYLAMLQETAPAASPAQDTSYARSVMAREAAAVEASKAQLRLEAQQALVRAGQLFREVVKAEYSGEGEMGIVTQRTILHWAKALCTRAALAEQPQEAAELYQSAVDKLQAMAAADPAHVPGLRALGMALLDLAALPSTDAYPLLQEAMVHLGRAAELGPADRMLQAALRRCEDELQHDTA